MFISRFGTLLWKEILICILVTEVLSESIDCDLKDNYTGKIINVTINATIEDNNTYVFHKESTYKIKITFEPGQNSGVLYLDLKTEFLSMPVSFSMVGFSTDGCKNHDVVCPVIADQVYNYTTDLKIKTIFPSMPYTVQIIIKGLTPIACKTINIKIEG